MIMASDAPYYSLEPVITTKIMMTGDTPYYHSLNCHNIMGNRNSTKIF